MPTFREQMAAKMTPLLAPIPGSNPAGSDPTSDETFERIKAEIGRMSSVDAREPSWREIQELGGELLSKRAKDLRVAGWKGVALFKLEGWSGLAEALLTFDGLARGFWDTMYPDARRARARINAFTWLADALAKHAQSLPVSAADADAVRTCDEALRGLDQFLADKLGNDYPGPGVLRGVVREKVAAIPEPPAPAAAPAWPPSGRPVAAPVSVPAPGPGAANGSPIAADGAAAAAPAVSAVPSAPTSAGDAESAVKEIGRTLVQAAAVIRGADATRAWAYRLQRWGAWLTVQDAPPAEGGRTRIRQPPEATQRRLATLRDGQKWLDLLQAAEEATGVYLFWLDLHRSVALAMDRLGASFASAREAVGREVTAFVGRLPVVPSLAFADGTPFADPATRGWLDEETARWRAGGGPSPATAAVSAEDEEAAQRFSAAQRLVTDGKVAEALAAASLLAARAPDGRARFRFGLAVGKMALEGSRPEVARPIFERLAEEAEARRLDEWEPALCATLYSYLLTAIRATMRGKAAGADLAPKEQSAFDKLCRLDPAAALKFGVG